MADFTEVRRRAAAIVEADAGEMSRILGARLEPAQAEYLARHAARLPAWTLDALEAMLKNAESRGTGKIVEPSVARVLQRFAAAQPRDGAPAAADLVAASYTGIRLCELANMTPPPLVAGELAEAAQFCRSLLGDAAVAQEESLVGELQMLALKSVFNLSALGDAFAGMFRGGAAPAALKPFMDGPPPGAAPQTVGAAAPAPTRPQPAAAPGPDATGDGRHDPGAVGRWTYEDHYFSGGFTGVTRRTRIFLADGRFVESGSASASMTHRDSGGNWQGSSDFQAAAPGDRGAWSTSGKVLKLEFEDGMEAVMEYYIEGAAMLTTQGGKRKLWRR